ncbi:MAG: hypothetical protein ACLUEC_07275 [Coprococcus sp.]
MKVSEVQADTVLLRFFLNENRNTRKIFLEEYEREIFDKRIAKFSVK